MTDQTVYVPAATFERTPSKCKFHELADCANLTQGDDVLEIARSAAVDAGARPGWCCGGPAAVRDADGDSVSLPQKH